MRTLNVVNPAQQASDWELVMHLVSMNMSYEQAKEWFVGVGLYVPKDQFDIMQGMFDIALELDIGNRQGEGYTNETK